MRSRPLSALEALSGGLSDTARTMKTSDIDPGWLDAAIAPGGRRFKQRAPRHGNARIARAQVLLRRLYIGTMPV